MLLVEHKLWVLKAMVHSCLPFLGIKSGLLPYQTDTPPLDHRMETKFTYSKTQSRFSVRTENNSHSEDSIEEMIKQTIGSKNSGTTTKG